MARVHDCGGCREKKEGPRSRWVSPLEKKTNGFDVWSPRPLFVGFLPFVRLPFRGSRDRCRRRQSRMDGGEKELLEREPLAGRSTKSPTVPRRCPPTRPRRTCPCLSPLR